MNFWRAFFSVYQCDLILIGMLGRATKMIQGENP